VCALTSSPPRAPAAASEVQTLAALYPMCVTVDEGDAGHSRQVAVPPPSALRRRASSVCSYTAVACTPAVVLCPAAAPPAMTLGTRGCDGGRQGDKLYLVKVTDRSRAARADGSRKQRMLITFGEHAREFLPVESFFKLVHDTCKALAAGEEETVRHMGNVELLLIGLVNPDGRRHLEKTKDWCWRGMANMVDARTRTRTRAHTPTFVCTCTFVGMYACICVCMLQICMCICVHVYMCTCTYAYVCICIHVHMHMYVCTLAYVHID